jgi:hypothetical protein
MAKLESDFRETTDRSAITRKIFIAVLAGNFSGCEKGLVCPVN